MSNDLHDRKIEWVENYFELDGRACGDCVHAMSWKEPHGERLSECGLLSGKAITGGDGRYIDACPALWEELEHNPRLDEVQTLVDDPIAPAIPFIDLAFAGGIILVLLAMLYGALRVAGMV
jgi:hypothetical protein